MLLIVYVYICCVNLTFLFFFFFKQKTAYEMRISDWSSDVCSSDLAPIGGTVTISPRCWAETIGPPRSPGSGAPNCGTPGGSAALSRGPLVTRSVTARLSVL